MVRVQIHLTELQLSRARAISTRTGLPVAELVRRALDKFLNEVADESNDGAVELRGDVVEAVY